MFSPLDNYLTYQATDNFVPTNQFEIGVSTGDLLGIIQQKDPMGDRSRWFCDNGVSQGFVPASLLAPLGTGDSAQLASDPVVTRVDSPTQVQHLIKEKNKGKDKDKHKGTGIDKLSPRSSTRSRWWRRRGPSQWRWWLRMTRWKRRK